MVETPECEKLAAVREKSQAIGEFLEWLQSGEADNTKFERPVFLAAYAIKGEEWDARKGKYAEIPENEWEVSETRVYPFSYNTQELLAKFFGIDLAKVEDERRALLEEVRNS